MLYDTYFICLVHSVIDAVTGIINEGLKEVNTSNNTNTYMQAINRKHYKKNELLFPKKKKKEATTTTITTSTFTCIRKKGEILRVFHSPSVLLLQFVNNLPVGFWVVTLVQKLRELFQVVQTSNFTSTQWHLNYMEIFI